MQGVDEVFGDEAGVEKNRDIAEAGMQEMREGFGRRGSVKGQGGDVGDRSGTRSGTGGKGEDEGNTGAGLREVRY
jgi:hypothetical protein